MRNSSEMQLVNVRENNLRNLTVSIPHNQLIVVTGVSGSGKSTLAFDTIYAEGARRYIETFSPYTRQFLDRLEQPDLDSISGVRPALALEQRNRTTSSRSTVGTVTEINDYLKVIWANLATLHCPDCGVPIVHYTPSLVATEVLNSNSSQVSQLYVVFPLSYLGDASLESFAATLQAEGFLRFLSAKDEKIERLDTLTDEAQLFCGELFVVVERFNVQHALPDSTAAKDRHSRVMAAVGQSYHFGHGRAIVVKLNSGGKIVEVTRYQERLCCPSCSREFPPPRPGQFSFNSPLGACGACHGFGKTLEIDPRLLIPDPGKSVADGAIACWKTPATRREQRKLMEFCSREKINTALPWFGLPSAERDLILHGKKGKGGYSGILGWFEKLKRHLYKMHVRVFLSRYRSERTCPECGGGRLKAEGLAYRLKDRSLREIWQLPVGELRRFFADLALEYASNELADMAIDEVVSRLQYLDDIGLSYVTLDRQTRTLSGGEYQRVCLTSIIGSRLVNTTLVLDEPTIALHPRDTQRLIGALKVLRDRGNTVIVVEHEREVMNAAEQIIDLGPLSGAAGGEIVYQGDRSGIEKVRNSLTGRYLAGDLELDREHAYDLDPVKGSVLAVRNARAHNLKGIDLAVPLGGLVVLTGVSGSGKSSFVHQCLFENYQRQGRECTNAVLRFGAEDTIDAIEGLDQLSEIVLIDQSPIGKSPRSNPGTYTKVWDVIRDALADTDEAKRLGLGRSSFSFNVAGGRCPDCEGAGYHRIEMQFLADVFVVCEQCQGSRFKDAVLGVRYAGKNVRDLLNLTLEETVQLFDQADEPRRSSKVKALLSPLLQLGLGYLKLGQPLSEVSGGEAQRIKLATYLTEGNSKRCLFILDEPTTGLHPYNISFLLATFDRLLERGHSILCVEHNQDVIKCADWMIELGPEGGDGGGEIVVAGKPLQLLKDPLAVRRSLTLQELKRGLVKHERAQVGGATKFREHNTIDISGAREHNLKDLTLSIPKNKFTVVSGVSGSGKSTLVFDILYQEGQRRYIDCLSPYARQFITQLKRAEVDRVDSIPPTIAISQKTSPPMGISTVATTTELYQYLRLLFCKVGVQHCPKHDLPIQGMAAEQIVDAIIEYVGSSRMILYAPVVSGRKGSYNELFQRALTASITEARVDGKIVTVTSDLTLARHKLHDISLVVATVSDARRNRELLVEAVQQALLLGSGTVEVAKSRTEEPQIFSTERVCPKCSRGFRELDPQDFSFRSARGVCPKCSGWGCLNAESDDLSKRTKCPDCAGDRIGPVGRHVYLGGRSIGDVHRLTPPEMLKFIEQLKFPQRVKPITDPIVSELKNRLQVLIAVGLDYLHLDRDAFSISGGEAQRLRLARSLGSPLTGVCYIFDEPTIGLHPSDHQRLMEIIFRLRDNNNTVIVVEHDEETICQADHIIDFGPLGGRGGGEVVAAGSLSMLVSNTRSTTGTALRQREENLRLGPLGAPRRLTPPTAKGSIQICGATANNLKTVSAAFPYEQLTVVCGVSGAGKSSLVHGTLVPAVTDEFTRSKKKKHAGTTWDSVLNLEHLKRLVEIDQTPLGKTSSSTPASFLGIFDDIRKLFALTPQAQARGLGASFFSFNTGKGKCPACGGKGLIKVPMSFLPEAINECEECRGMRYTQQALDVLYQGMSIGDVLQKTMSEAKEIFTNHSMIRRVLSYVDDLGLGYISLGQPTHTLSGGEAQRLKIARELGAREAVDTLYVLDEPTIGLHMVDVERLVHVLRQLIAKGNTVVLIEHNLDVIAAADHLIEMGPGPGERGGRVVYSGSPQGLIKLKSDTPTKSALLSRRSLIGAAAGFSQIDRAAN